MFRVTKDHHHEIWYLHKRVFYFWWIEVANHLTIYKPHNKHFNPDTIYRSMLRTRLVFPPTSDANYRFITERGYCDIEYFTSADHYRQTYPEYFI